MMDIDRRLLAVFVAGHAVVEARIGAVFEVMGIAEGAQWNEPERPLAWRSDQEAVELTKRLAAGYAALMARGQTDPDTAGWVARRDLEGLADVIEVLEGERPSMEEAAFHALRIAGPLLREEPNERAVALVERELLEFGSLSMHEVDFLIESADGDPEALDDLVRYRAAFSPSRIPWPDHT
jgi:hypothetical protein